MKLIKWLLGGLLTLVLLVGAGAAALVYLVDWNDFRETIQNQTKKHTGRDLTIAGDLKPTVFPFIGVSIGDLALSNAQGFPAAEFAKMGSADVKVELLPLLKKEVNVKTVELHGLTVNLERAADGTTNWDDLVNASGAKTTTEGTGSDTEVEVEGDSAAIAALAVGSISVTDANVSWNDAQTGTDATLKNFNLKTGAIELAKPFSLSTDFELASNSMGLTADVNGNGNVMLDLENQIYSLTALALNTNANSSSAGVAGNVDVSADVMLNLKSQVYTVNGLSLTSTASGDSLPNGKIDAVINGDIMAELAEQKISIKPLSVSALGVDLDGNASVTNLDTSPAVSATLGSNTFNLKDLFALLGVAPPVTADANAMTSTSVSMSLDASPSSAALNDLVIKVDDTTLSGNASIPSFGAAIPPLRFALGVDAIDLDRYLPPVADAPVATSTQAAPAAAPAATGDEPIALPLALMRQLDVQGEFKVGSVKVKNLTTSNIAVPLTANNGRIAINGLQAGLYQGQLTSTATIDATTDTPAYGVEMNLAGIEAEPLLVDLLQKKSFLSGRGQVSANITTAGDSVNALKAALNGGFNTAFNDGSINGVNLGYQIRRAKAVLSGQSLPEDQANVKTDFTAMAVSGQFTNGVLTSDDLDMRSPLLRVGGAGQVDLPGEQVDYTLTTLITGSAQGQGGKDLEALKGVKLDIPIRGSFADLSANFAGVILAGLKDNIAGNLKNQVEARAKAEADRLKAEAEARLKAEEAKARERLAAEKAKVQEKLDAQKAKAQQQLQEQQQALEKKAADALGGNKENIEGALNNLFKK